MNTGVTARIWN